MTRTAEQERRHNEASDRAHKMLGMLEEGQSLAQIGAAYGISRQRVHQIIHKYCYPTVKVDSEQRSE